MLRRRSRHKRCDISSYRVRYDPIILTCTDRPSGGVSAEGAAYWRRDPGQPLAPWTRGGRAVRPRRPGHLRLAGRPVRHDRRGAPHVAGVRAALPAPQVDQHPRAVAHPAAGAGQQRDVDRRRTVAAVRPAVHGLPRAGRAVAGHRPLARRVRFRARAGVPGQRGAAAEGDQGRHRAALGGQHPRHRRQLRAGRCRRRPHLPDPPALALRLPRRRPRRLHPSAGRVAHLHRRRALPGDADRPGLLPARQGPRESTESEGDTGHSQGLGSRP
ncbi:hypothetical protein SGPA1_50630 [Streptomyces misionensis JCM 4497]